MGLMQKFIDAKKKSIALAKQSISLWELQGKLINKHTPTRNFKAAISVPKDTLHIISEVKKASPSAGIIIDNYNPGKIARTYETYKADAVSILTEEKYFLGDIYHLSVVKEVTSLPVLRKDFIIDEYQIYESRFYGADAILLIASLLFTSELQRYLDIAKGLGLDCLVEVHTELDLKKVLDTDAQIIGINNRSLATLKVDLNNTARLRPKIPKGKIVVSESGIRSKADIKLLKEMDINAILIGHYLLEKKDNIGKALKELISK
ncbi:MAG: indole-3-glycerol phosphate synthase TrpC [bacterium]|nr:indole-3-glycerol phosphate synthase TrpC [bacterium]